MTSKAQDKLLLLLSTQGGPPAACRRLTALSYVTDGSVGYMDDCWGVSEWEERKVTQNAFVLVPETMCASHLEPHTLKRALMERQMHQEC